MKFLSTTEGPLKIKTDLLVVEHDATTIKKGTLLEKIDLKLNKELSHVLRKEEFKGKSGESKLINTGGSLKARYVLVVGVGEAKEITSEKVRQMGAGVRCVAAKIKAAHVLCAVEKNKKTKISADVFYQAFAEGFLLSGYQFTRYTKPTPSFLKEVLVCVAAKDKNKAQQAFRTATVFAEGVCLARNLINTPAADMTPLILAKEARKLNGIRTRVHLLPAIQKMKMGAFLSVAEGSTKNKPCFIEMHYVPRTKAKKKIAFVGKGVTFDTGGYSIKPAKSMETMKDDMSGAAAVIGLMSVLPKLKPQVEVHAYIAATENMVDGFAQRPGDVCRAMNGKTIEVLNTDAEGRLTLADALHYANKKKPDYLIDMATLTGACVVALGHQYSGIMCNDKELEDKLIAMGKEAGENLWPLPLAEEYRDELKSPIADLKNVGGPYGGTITAGLFLENFVGKTKWAHIDIAGPSWTDKPLPYIPRGGTGVMVRTMANFLMSY